MKMAASSATPVSDHPPPDQLRDLTACTQLYAGGVRFAEGMQRAFVATMRAAGPEKSYVSTMTCTPCRPQCPFHSPASGCLADATGLSTRLRWCKTGTLTTAVMQPAAVA